MIKLYETFRSLEEYGLNIGDRVMVHYKDSNYYGATGNIVLIKKTGTPRGDCTVFFDFNKTLKDFYYTNLTKVVELVEIPTGEIVVVNDEDMEELEMTGLVDYDKEKKFYFFRKEERWQIDYFII
jgi:hypothetical protein